MASMTKKSRVIHLLRARFAQLTPFRQGYIRGVLLAYGSALVALPVFFVLAWLFLSAMHLGEWVVRR
jgi:hypothetical protein